MKLRTAVSFLIGLSVMTSVARAQEWPKCSERSEVEKRRDYYNAQAKAMSPAVEQMQVLAQDSQRINQISSGLAVASATGLSLVTYRGINLYGGVDRFLTPYRIYRLNPVVEAYFKSVSWRIAGGVVTGIFPFLMASAFGPTAILALPVFVVLPAMAMVEISYPIGMGVYQLRTEHGTMEIHEADVKDGEVAIRKSLAEISELKRKVLSEQPGALKDSLTFGGASSDYHNKLALLTQSELQHWKMLAAAKNLQIQMLQASCEQ